MIQRIVVRSGIRLHILGDADCIVLIKQRIVYGVHKIQDFSQMRLTRVCDMGVIISFPVLLQLQTEHQQVFSSVIQQIHQLKLRPDLRAVPFQLCQFSVFNQPVHIRASHFIRNAPDRQIRALNPDRNGSVFRQRKHRVPDIGCVHAFCVPMEKIEGAAALFQVNQRQ